MILTDIRPGLRADELAALVNAECHARALAAALDRAAAIDAEGVPNSYRMLATMASDLLGDVAALRDRREWIDLEAVA